MTWLGVQSNWKRFGFLIVLMVTLCSYYLSVENGDSRILSGDQSSAFPFSSLKSKLPFSSHLSGLDEKLKGTSAYFSSTPVNSVSVTNLTRLLLVSNRGPSALQYMSFKNSTSNIWPSKSKITPLDDSSTALGTGQTNDSSKHTTASRNVVAKIGSKSGVATIASKTGVAKIFTEPEVGNVVTESKMKPNPTYSYVPTAIETGKKTATENNVAIAIDTEVASTVSKTDIKPKVVIIVTAKRSGSSFVGEFFNYHPDVFYQFEPLSAVANVVMKTRGKKINFIDTSLKVLNDSFHCDFHTKNTIQYANAKFCGSNEKLERKHLCEGKTSWSARRTKISAWERTCREHNVIAAKIIRIHDIAVLKTLLSSIDLEWRIVHLVRDPRPTERSRKKTRPNMDLIRRKGTDKNDEIDLCQTLERNLKYWIDTPDWLKGRYKMVRFEDIAASPKEKAKELLEFVGLDLAHEVVKWIQENTLGEKKDQKKIAAFSTSRNAGWVLEAWRHDMDWPYVQKIQKVCSVPMKSLGYALMPDIHSLRDQNIPSTLPLIKPHN